MVAIRPLRNLYLPLFNPANSSTGTRNPYNNDNAARRQWLPWQRRALTLGGCALLLVTTASLFSSSEPLRPYPSSPPPPVLDAAAVAQLNNALASNDPQPLQLDHLIPTEAPPLPPQPGPSHPLDPVFDQAPWNLSSSYFPRIISAPDPGWAPPIWYTEPIAPLRIADPPSTYRCDDVSHNPRTGSPMLFVGIFTTAKKRAARDMIRKYQVPTPAQGVPSGIVELKFIIGRPKGTGPGIAGNPSVALGRLTSPQRPQPVAGWLGSWFPGRRNASQALQTKRDDGSPDPYADSESARQRAEGIRSLEELERENEEHGDIVVLDVEENLIDGKTHAYWRYLATRKEPPPRFGLKADDDTYLIMPNVLDSFASLDCGTNVYWGNSFLCAHEFPFHFGGLAYALSWPLIKWIGTTRLTPEQIRGNEDARTGSWLQNLDLNREPVTLVDHNILMGWYASPFVRIGTETVALHEMKDEHLWQDQFERIQSIWRKANKPFKWTGAKEWTRAHSPSRWPKLPSWRPTAASGAGAGAGAGWPAGSPPLPPPPIDRRS